MTMKMALLSSPSTQPSLNPHSLYHLTYKPYLTLIPLKKTQLSIKVSSPENVSANVVEEKVTQVNKDIKFEKSEDSVGVVGPTEDIEASNNVNKFKDSKWVNGTWDLQKFQKDGVTYWDGVIDAEARRRKWLETYPESTSNDEPIIFDTSIIPWWAWIKRFHLPDAELLNGRAAMIGFFMSYFVDSLTGSGVVDQTSNFFCKTLLFVSVLGVLFIRKNEDVENLKKLFEETTFYDKQWQATWQEETKKD